VVCFKHLNSTALEPGLTRSISEPSTVGQSTAGQMQTMEVMNRLLLLQFHVFCGRSVSVWFRAKKTLFLVVFGFLAVPSEGLTV